LNLAVEPVRHPLQSFGTFFETAIPNEDEFQFSPMQPFLSSWTFGQETPVRVAATARLRSETEESAAMGGEGSATIVPPSWDVKHGHGAENGGNPLTMAIPALSRIGLNALGGALVGMGWGVGKVGETVGLQARAADTPTFRLGLTSWMLSNGILPDVVYEPVDEETSRRLSEHYQTGHVSSPSDAGLTPVIVSNHTCYMDGVVLAGKLGAPRVVAMAATRKVPIVGKIMEEMDVIFVDRKDKASREMTKEAIREHCSSWQPGDRPLLIFPEGTTTNGREIIPFRKGAFEPGVPVRPVLIVYNGQWDPASTSYRRLESGEVVGYSEVEWVRDFFGHWTHPVHIRVLAPYVPDAREREDAALFASNVCAMMDAKLQLVRKEVEATSWKVAAGREVGGLGFEFADLAKIGIRKSGLFEG